MQRLASLVRARLWWVMRREVLTELGFGGLRPRDKPFVGLHTPDSDAANIRGTRLSVSYGINDDLNDVARDVSGLHSRRATAATLAARVLDAVGDARAIALDVAAKIVVTKEGAHSIGVSVGRVEEADPTRVGPAPHRTGTDGGAALRACSPSWNSPVVEQYVARSSLAVQYAGRAPR